MTTPVVETVNEPGQWKVKLTHPSLNRRTVFRSFSESRARRFLENRYPRGSEAYLESPSGVTEHHERERVDEYGVEAAKWAPFDPDTYELPEASAPPGETLWGDREG